MTNNIDGNTILSLDVGSKRIGVAIASLTARLPRALVTLQNEPDIFDQITKLAMKEGALHVIVGLPRGLDGQETEQTKYARSFAAELEARSGLKVQLQDEAVTSLIAKENLRGKSYNRSDIDALAATYILDDYLTMPKDNSNG